MTEDTDIAVVGDINMDIIPKPIEKDVPIKKDGQVFVEDVVYRRGGQGANFAVQLAGLGGDVAFHGKLGDDRHGEFLHDHLADQGVVPRVNLDPGVKTGTTLAVTWQDGQRHYISHTENNAQLSLEDIDMEAVKDAEHVARRGVWFSDPMLDGGNEELLRTAKEHGAETSIDLHWDPHWNRDSGKADRRRRQFYDALEHADLLMGNEEEVAQLAKKDTLAAAVDFLRKKGADTIVVHQGERGSTIFDEDGHHKIPTDHVDNPSNPTGTGDAYDAGFLHARMQGSDLEEAGKKGTEVAVKHLQDRL
ncbi:MAG: carbohydrate kinase family protein [Candidatus Nanohaloarchaea archaeon]|nr:carbohydrate kinase family protein [Candidatus Nanohaloarchaea archaeon]